MEFYIHELDLTRVPHVMRRKLVVIMTSKDFLGGILGKDIPVHMRSVDSTYVQTNFPHKINFYCR